MSSIKSMSKMKKQEMISALILIAPAVLFLIIWLILPAMYALVLSFTNYDILRPQLTKFVGFRNYIDIWQDKKFINALGNTMQYAFGVVPAQTIIALFLAVIANQKIRGKGFFRVIYYLPAITSAVAVASIFMFLFSRNGVINNMASIFGFESINWSTSEVFALPLIMIMAIWASTGLYMLIFLAGLQEIPASVYEAGEIDGANRWEQFYFISLPMLRDKLFFVLVIGFIGTFQVFDQAYIVSGGKGGPNGSTMTIVLYLYTEAFSNNKMGYASAAAFILFAIIFILTLIQKRIFKEEE
jgi:multiple sugar transport system permease protein